MTRTSTSSRYPLTATLKLAPTFSASRGESARSPEVLAHGA
jgi:hypothetical protein